MITFHPALPGLRLRINDTVCIMPERKQIRFPSTKKKRIRRKWAKRESNYGVVNVHHMLRIGDELIVSTKIFESLQKLALS